MTNQADNTPRNKTVSVNAIKQGSVIDHINAGGALDILRLLNINADGTRVMVGINLRSDKLKHKDIIKMSHRLLTETEIADIAVFAPEATINIIKDYQIINKITVKTPETIARILVCPNPNCITRRECVSSLFYVKELGQRVQLVCHYCEQLFERNEIKDFVL